MKKLTILSIIGFVALLSACENYAGGATSITFAELNDTIWASEEVTTSTASGTVRIAFSSPDTITVSSAFYLTDSDTLDVADSDKTYSIAVSGLIITATPSDGSTPLVMTFNAYKTGFTVTLPTVTDSAGSVNFAFWRT